MTSKNNTNKATAANVVPVLYRVEDAARALSLSRRTVYDLIRCGALRTVKVGARRLVPVSAVVEYANGLEAAA
ncbi:helix-turn-helix domain-containing protein [Myceligenerans pegani]|uniref:Helix-turn-helix domain-containing protein n=1 Tax=Myceligenerans pegani TaxID=2776917 RepID=A0ABR9N402_9MICO|nr:helix-turn-helix domain-containing protein [Myceligenerans sp. TRM 65318]MBE1877839.1 helix-turn-helix domain-containing protein [Myceligenerans sp. TRM 65318]MBE3020110.1 helix-turn-helix domain-containing protein [Myceligenerans sp. TRM 65318]